MNIKTILTVTAVAVGGSLLMGSRKVSSYQSVIDNLKVNIKGIRNIDFKNGQIQFNLDAEIVNPTEISINVPGNSLTVKRLHFSTLSGSKLGIANPNYSNLKIPAKSSIIVPNIPAVFSLVTISESFGEVFSILSDPTKLVVTTELELFGQTFTV